MLKHYTYIILALQLLLSSNSLANSDQAKSTYNIFSLSLEELMGIEVTTASKTEEKAFESASAIFVITNEDIIRSGVTSIPEALRMAPGIQVAQIDSNKWAITARGFNRQYSNKLLVLFDGRSVYTPTFSGVYWDSQDYVLEDIDRIEVVRGPGGTLWGENAVNGVINIITKKAKDTQGQYASMLAGNYDRFNTEYRYGGKTEDNAYYRIYGKYFRRDNTQRTDGVSMDDDWDVARSGFKYEKSLNSSTKYTIQGDIYEGTINQVLFLPVSGGTVETEADESFQGGNLVAKLSKKIDDGKNLDILFYIDHEDRDWLILDQRRTTLDLDVQYSFQAKPKHNTIVGFEIRSIYDMLDGKTYNYLTYTPSDLDYQIYSFFIQDKYEAIEDKLFLTFGSKFGYNEFTNFSFQPTVRASFLPSINHSFWSSISHAVRTPTRGEDGITVYATGAPLYQQGSKSYGNENLTAYELGYRFKKDNLLIDVTTFFNDYDDLRTQYFDGTNAYIVSNYGEGKVYGFEAASSLDIKSNWRVSLAYSFLKTDIQDDEGLTYLGDNLANEGISPQNQLALKSYYNFSNKLTMSNMLYFYDNLTASGKEVNAYTKFDTNISYQVSDELAVNFVGQNLFDSHHQEFSKALFSTNAEIGRHFYLKLRYRF
ncbi:MAG: TonB-dependent receptor [Rickettsiales bacterium]|jgi:iron complex outermembrane recepter protein|nr:TonB-dependent receptor [Rickettsiales bacterium]